MPSLVIFTLFIYLGLGLEPSFFLAVYGDGVFGVLTTYLFE